MKLNLSEVDGTKIDTYKLRELLQQLEFKSLLNILPPGMQTVGKSVSAGSLSLEICNFARSAIFCTLSVVNVLMFFPILNRLRDYTDFWKNFHNPFSTSG